MPLHARLQKLVRGLLSSIAHRIIGLSYPTFHKRILHLHRLVLARRLFQDNGGKIKHGPFAGLVIAKKESEVNPDFPAMYFGLYEKEILDALFQLPRTRDLFINLGAGDGYYPIGVLINRICKRSIAYEMDPDRQSVLKSLAIENGVEPQIEIRGFASADFHQEFTSAQLAQAVIFSDIEGGEFEIFTAESFRALKNSIIILELHTHLVPNGARKLQAMRESASEHFDIKEFTTGARDLSEYAELHDIPDVDRWFMAMEGRGPLMTWWVLSPR